MIFNKNKRVKRLGKINSNYPTISICDSKKELCEILAKKFEHENLIEIINGDIFKEKSDAIISPANSFGDMGGGIDKLIDNYYYNEAQEKVINQIRTTHFGELPVGNAVILNMKSKNFKYLIVSPTMRIPGRLRKDTINIYLSMRAILVEVLKFNEQNKDEIKRIILPGLGTGIGGLSYEECSNQMYKAYENIYLERWRDVKHPMIAPFVMRKQ